MKFSKMHGLGNDFMVIDGITQHINLSSVLIRELSDRHCGVGFDQLLIVEPPRDPNVDFYYRIFNADGREVGQCGNGVRCFALFVYMKQLTSKRTIRVSTKSRTMVLSIMDNNYVCVNMGMPLFNPSDIPVDTPKFQKIYIVTLGDILIKFGAVSLGNPHCVVIVDDIKKAKVLTLGKLLEQHQMFPEMINVSFMEIDTRHHIYLRVYERSVGETKACGSGACAAVAVGIMQGVLDKEVCVDLVGGRLIVCWDGYNQPLYMTGPAIHIYDGWISL